MTSSDSTVDSRTEADFASTGAPTWRIVAGNPAKQRDGSYTAASDGKSSAFGKTQTGHSFSAVRAPSTNWMSNTYLPGSFTTGRGTSNDARSESPYLSTFSPVMLP